jgi:hypothetical protein
MTVGSVLSCFPTSFGIYYLYVDMDMYRVAIRYYLVISFEDQSFNLTESGVDACCSVVSTRTLYICMIGKSLVSGWC